MIGWRGRWSLAWLLAGLGGLAGETAQARGPAELPPVAEPRELRPFVSAARRWAPVMVDGRLDEFAWRIAPVGRQFWQRNPHDGEPAEFSTEFRILYDDDAIYIGVRAFDPQPALIRSLLTRRDEDSPSDWLWVSIDSYHDRRTAFRFGLNPAGVQRDSLLHNDDQEDPLWDAVWDGATAIDGQGWSAEFRIPISQLRFYARREQTWGLQVGRTVSRRQEEAYWTPWPRSSSRVVGSFGELHELRGVDSPLHLELRPYVLTGVDARSGDDGRSVDRRLGAGLDAKYGVTSHLTLDVAVNPDFGQVEADPSQVNLTALETFFPEKRPFFLEGTDIFRFGMGEFEGAEESLFYSRRIGAAPHGPTVMGRLLVPPDATPILGASKLSGRSAGGWSMGALASVTGEEVAAVQRPTGEIAREVIEPMSGYGVLRLRKDLNDGRSMMGLVLTGVHRRFEGTGFAPLLHENAYAGGFEGSHRFGGGHYEVAIKAAASQVEGTPEAIARTQRASQRYYQRPDLDHVEFDPARRSLGGYAFRLSLSKLGGRYLRAGLGVDSTSPGFEVNDLGFQRRADMTSPWATLQLRDERPRTYLRAWYLTFAATETLNHAPEHLATLASATLKLLSPGYLGASAGYIVNVKTWDPGALRGGPALRGDTSHNFTFSFNTDPRRGVAATVSGNRWLRPKGNSKQYSLTGETRFQFASNLSLALGAALRHRLDDVQFVTERRDAAGVPHYVLALIDQYTTSATVRLSYTVIPTLSIQLYGQPFVSTADYSGFKEVTAPRALNHYARFNPLPGSAPPGENVAVDLDGDGVEDYAFRQPGFGFRQLRTNFITRWEYQRGAALFLVWSHARTSEEPGGKFALGHELGRLAATGGEHVVMLKFNYWAGF